MKKYNEADVNYCMRNVQIKTVFGQIRKFCNDIVVGVIEGKQLDLCKCNIIFCHVDCFCLQEKKEDEARSIFLFQD